MTAALLNEAALAARLCFGFKDANISPLPGGRVNESFVLASGSQRFVLQKLNAIYGSDPALGLNWKTLHETLAGRAEDEWREAMPRVFPDLGGSFTASLAADGPMWRLTAHIAGRPAPRTLAGAMQSARLMGALHRLLNCPAPVPLLPPPEAELVNQRLNLPEDFLELRLVYRRHPHLEDLAPLIEQGAEAAALLPACPDFVTVFQLKDVLIHGDPKADNFIFAEDGQPRALVDWDDARYGHLLIDVAEMLRSFGRPPELTEGFCPEAMRAVLSGYAQTGLPLSEGDITLLPAVLRAVCLNLARRYMTDALAELFFRWDSEKYPSLYIQNKSRSQAMLDMAEHLLDNEMRLVDIFLADYNNSFLP